MRFFHCNRKPTVTYCERGILQWIFLCKRKMSAEADLSALFHIEEMAAVRRASKKFYNCRKKELTGIFYRCRIKITSTKVENKSQRENLL